MEISLLNTLYKRYKKPGTLRIIIIYGIFIAVVIVLSVTAYHYNRKQMYYGIRINLSGRQRMYTQKMTKELLLSTYDRNMSSRIQDTMDRFESTLYALTYGGKAVIDAKSEGYGLLPPTENTHIKNHLLEIISLWEKFRDNMEEYMASGNSRTFQYILNNNEKLLRSMNQVVFELQVESERNSFIMRILVLTTLLLIFGFISFNLGRSIKNLKQARKEIDELQKLLPICSNCKRIRVDDEQPEDPQSWVQVEQYLATHNDMLFSHSLCPDCIRQLYPEIADRINRKK